MERLKYLFDFYINSSIHVALAVISFTLLTYFQLDLDPNIQTLLFVGLATISGYNFVKYFGLAKFHHRSLATWLKWIQVFSLLCTLSLVYFVFQFDSKTLIFLGFLGLVTFLYAIPFIPKRYFLDHNQNLRHISGLKIYVIGFVWTAVTIGLPLVEHGLNMTWDIGVLSIQRFLVVLVLMLPFEIRDLKYDSIKLSTIPQSIGIRWTKALGCLLMLLVFLLEYLKDMLLQNELLITLIIAVLTMVLLLVSNKEQSKYFSSFIVESIPIIWMLLALFSQFFIESSL